MSNKDWTGNKNSIFKTLGASNHTEKERQNEDYYATDPEAAEWLLKIEDIPKDRDIWEPAAGELHLSNVFKKHGYHVISTDLIVRNEEVIQKDFLKKDEGEHKLFNGTIITNPPYKFAAEFVESAMEKIADGNKVCMFLKLQFLEGKKRRELFKK